MRSVIVVYSLVTSVANLDASVSMMLMVKVQGFIRGFNVVRVGARTVYLDAVKNNLCLIS